ncbi:hypothetical protein CsSME_00015155 [Camellia sinensis var. sinensis]
MACRPQASPSIFRNWFYSSRAQRTRQQWLAGPFLWPAGHHRF